MQRLADACPDRPLFVYLPGRGPEEVSLSVGETHRRALAIAAHLRELARPGDRVLLVQPAGLEFHVSFLATVYAGMVAVPAYPPGLREKRGDKGFNRIASIVRDCSPSVALSSGRGLDLFRAVDPDPTLAQLRLVATEDVPDADATAWTDPQLTSDTLAFLQYTSGSTSEPKGVLLTHGNIMANQELIATKFQHTHDTRIVSWLPVYHDMGLCCALFQGLYCGALSVLMPPMTFLMHPLRWLEVISKYRGSVSGAPNFAYDLCVARARDQDISKLDLSSWGLAFNGSEPVRQDTMDSFTERFAAVGFRRGSFYPCYGLAEATLFVTGGTRGNDPVVKPFDRDALSQRCARPAQDKNGTVALVGCGHDFGDTTVRIVDPDTLSLCAPGQIGEIWAASPSVGIGYWNRSAESAHTFEAHLPGDPGLRFLRTGDLGFIEAGELFVAGRMKDMIIVHGANHYPQDIERVAESAHPALAPNASAAFSIEAGDGREHIIIVSEVVRGAKTAGSEEVERAVRFAVAANLELTLHGVTLLRPGSIPRTSSGKIQRSLCRQRYQKAAFEDVLYVA
jgi:acyl-CoA synthetase (AMP-forming)/AMP-acid ligase II